MSKLERAKSCVTIILSEVKLQRRMKSARRVSYFAFRYSAPLNWQDAEQKCCGYGAGVFYSRSVVCSSVVWAFALLAAFLDLWCVF